MKAIKVKEFGGPEVLRLEEVPAPRPGAGQVLVRMHAIGVNPVETYIRSGTYARLPELPYTPGNDGAGVIEQVGSDVNEFKAGDRVYTAGSISGTYAEFVLCKTEQVHRLPANVSFAQGAAMGTPYATAYRGLFQRADARPGETVLVHGASGGKVEIDPRDTMQRDADVRGMALPNTPPSELASIHAALVAGLENGTLRPVIGKEFPLVEAAQAHRAVMESGASGKIVLIPEK